MYIKDTREWPCVCVCIKCKKKKQGARERVRSKSLSEKNMCVPLRKKKRGSI